MALSFYDHARQGYADVVPHEADGEIMVGDYDGEVEVGSLGEFKIIFHRFTDRGSLAPQLCVFGDAVEALLVFLAVGGGGVLASDVESVDEFAGKLAALGLTDRSEKPIEAVS